MTTVLVFAAAALVWGGLYLLMTWAEARAHSQMVRAVARVKHEHRLRSRTPAGSGQAGSRIPIVLPVPAGVELRVPAQPVAPPATSALTGAGAGDGVTPSAVSPRAPRARQAFVSVGGVAPRAVPPTGVHSRRWVHG